MLSTLAVKRCLPKVLQNVRLLSITPKRSAASDTSDNLWLPNIPSSRTLPVSLEEKVFYWKRANDIFYGPERDFKNFPHPKQSEDIEKDFNFGVIPTRWFMPIYQKTGVSGCYLVIWAPLLMAINKEYFLINSELLEIGVMIMILKMFFESQGKKLQQHYLNVRKKHRQDTYEIPFQEAKALYEAQKATVQDNLDTQDAVPVIYDAKREQLDLQLEVEYRERLEAVHTAVKRRLDYMSDLEQVTKAFEKDHMVNWVVQNVQKSMTPTQEKEVITNCISNLKNLSKKATL